MDHMEALALAGEEVDQALCRDSAVKALQSGPLDMVNSTACTKMLADSKFQPEIRRELIAMVRQVLKTSTLRASTFPSLTDVGRRTKETSVVSQQSCMRFPNYLTIREWELLLDEGVGWRSCTEALLRRCSEIGLVNIDEETSRNIWATAVLARCPPNRSRGEANDRNIKIGITCWSRGC